MLVPHVLPFWISHPWWSEQTTRRRLQHSRQGQSRCCRSLCSSPPQLVQNWSLARRPREREYLGDKDKQWSLPALKHGESITGCLWRAPAHVGYSLQFPRCTQRTTIHNDSPEGSLLHQHLPRMAVTSNTEPKHSPAGIWLGLPTVEGTIDSLFKNASTISVVLSVSPLNTGLDTSGNSTADFQTISILSVLHRHLKTGFQ